jgi:hypothetical protein
MVNMAEEAPGDLETVRNFLNTWEIPNDTREPVDRLSEWAAEFGELEGLAELRDDLRAALGQTHPIGLTGALSRHPLTAALGPERPVGLAPVDPTAAGRLLALAVDAIADGKWHRLRACPDCQWVFYDSSRNASRTWCAMTAGGPTGRGCGSIAKTRAYRARTHG